VDLAMHDTKKSVLLVAMPFAGITIPSIQLSVLGEYCKSHDVPIRTRDLYLKAAEIYGLQNYHSLIYPPNDSYTAQMAFSKYVFPAHWKNTEEKFKNYFTTHIRQNTEGTLCSFEEYVQRTDLFYQWVLDHLEWGSADIIGFSLNYGQLLPSLAVAKTIKERAPEKVIVFGGSRTIDELGKNVLRAFDYVDYIVSGDGEDALVQLATEPKNYPLIPRLTHRVENEVEQNKGEASVDLNTAPLPSYDQFYQELATTSDEIRQFFQYGGKLPVEISRGCWWNRCSFCNLNLQHHKYREKSVDRIIQEITWLSERYHMMDFQLIGNTLPKTEYTGLFERLKQLGRDFSFFVEARAGQLRSDEYRMMSEAGFRMIQTGIESFSRQYLQKINKGVRVIDNIAALKFCKENKIKNTYNLIVRYPNEDARDFEETQKVVSLLKGYLDPPQLCELRVMHGSPIYCHPEHYNIDVLKNTPVDVLMYPAEILDKGFSFVFDYTSKTPSPQNPWESLVDGWKKEEELAESEAVRSHMIVDALIFYFVDGGSFVKIYDKRNRQNIRIYVLNEMERAVFLACLDVVSFQQLQHQFVDIPEFELVAMLQSFEQNGLVFVEDGLYLSLPLRYSVGTHPQIMKECEANAIL
jgi:ribosomal peptide maturation radical SAM protein 1